MEKRDVFLQMEQMEEQIGIAFADLSSLKKKIVLLLEENNQLQQENQRLRQQLKITSNGETMEDPDDKSGSTVGEGYDNLARLYMEGFHICNVYYGHLRTEGDCLFCMAFLNK